jgi:predicted nucleotidyltransferase
VPAAPEFQPQKILRVLTSHEVTFIVVGGLAATIHGSEFVTFDVDITPKTDEENLSRLSDVLRELNARVWTESEPEGLPFDHDAESLAQVQILNLITDHGRLDITMVPSGTQGYEDLRRDAVAIDLGGVEVPVASLADVVRSKEAAAREKDLRSLPSLRRLLDESH